MSRKLFFLGLVLGLLWLASPLMAADPGKGHILVEYWLDIGSGTAVTDLTSNALFPDNPTGSQWVDSWLFPPGSSGGSSWHDNYGDRMRGYIYPPQTGDYTFWIAGDDLCELWLSTDDTPANRKLIARVTGWTNAVDWDNTTGGSTDVAAMKSQPIPLKAGQRYYMETLHKEGGGGDSVGVAWAGPGIGATHVLLDGKYCAAFIRDPEPMFMARNPSPADGTIGVSAPLLQWTVGGTAMFHDVYFGTDPNPPLVSPKQMFALYYHIPGLQPGATYYWKVDEIEADGTTKYAGPVWSFVAQALTAYYPTPADKAGSVSPTAPLTWQAGQNATKHHLYLSDSLNAVTQGDASADKGEMDGTSYTPTDLLGATTYYWRVDELAPGSAVRTGDVWSFTTFILVDDFEAYNDDLDAGTTIFDTWIDGLTDGLSNSTVGNFQAPFAEQTIVHGGTQSMPMDFDNTKTPFFSEATREFSPLQDWTVNDVNTLTLWVRGYPAPQSVAVTEAAGKITLTGDGTDIWNNSDQFTFAFKTLNGDGSMTARVVSIGPGTNTWAKAGVMIRDSLDGGSTHAMTVITANSDGTAGNGASFQYRPAADGASSNIDSTTVVAAPYWVKIDRLGDSLSGSYSADGKTWRSLGISQVIAMNAPVYIGLCVTSHAAGEQRTFEFDSVSTTGNVTGSWQGAVIDSPRYNGAASLYVTVQDSAGKAATVTDPVLVNTAAWTAWKIPLSSLTGVNLAKVKKLYIGVGDKANPAADGAGRIYIDDIQVGK
jgi:hypothetical protein